MVKLTESLVLARSRATDLESVRKLNVWGSDISDVSILRKMANVQVVSLSVNKISTLVDFAYCPNLEELYIRKNSIGDLQQICHLRKLPKLRTLWLSDNPCAVTEGYRMTVLRTLPNLQKLDNVAVEENEVNAAIEQGQELSLEDSSSTDVPARDVLADVTASSQPFSINNTQNGTETGTLDKESSKENKNKENPVSLSLEETNNIRSQLGLKPLPIDKLPAAKPRYTHGAKARNSNLLQAVMHLIKELDAESLEVVQDAVRNRLEAL